MVSSPRISIVPAGCRINRDYARRGWATNLKTGYRNWGVLYRVLTVRLVTLKKNAAGLTPPAQSQTARVLSHPIKRHGSERSFGAVKGRAERVGPHKCHGEGLESTPLAVLGVHGRSCLTQSALVDCHPVPIAAMSTNLYSPSTSPKPAAALPQMTRGGLLHSDATSDRAVVTSSPVPPVKIAFRALSPKRLSFKNSFVDPSGSEAGSSGPEPLVFEIPSSSDATLSEGSTEDGNEWYVCRFTVRACLRAATVTSLRACVLRCSHVCVCARACVRSCVCVCVCARGRAHSRDTVFVFVPGTSLLSGPHLALSQMCAPIHVRYA